MTNGPSKDTDISNVFIENKKWHLPSPDMDIFRVQLSPDISSSSPRLNVAQYNVEELKVVLVCELFIYCSWRISGALQTGVLVQVLVIWVRILTFTPADYLALGRGTPSFPRTRQVHIYKSVLGALKPSLELDWVTWQLISGDKQNDYNTQTFKINEQKIFDWLAPGCWPDPAIDCFYCWEEGCQWHVDGPPAALIMNRTWGNGLSFCAFIIIRV